MESPPSSSSSDSSQSSTSESKQNEGYEFNGAIYPTYNEMVAAKRERNRLVLERKMSEVALFAAKSAASVDFGGRVDRERKRKREAPGKKKSSEPVSSNLRRNPRRQSTSAASSILQSSNLKNERDRKAKSNALASESESAASSISKSSIQQLKPLRIAKRYALESESAASSISQASNKQLKSIPNTKRYTLTARAGIPYIPIPAPPENSHDHDVHSKQTLNLKTPNYRSRSRGPEAEDMLPKSEVKDMSVLLEHVVLNGFRVRNREALWKDFCNQSSDTRDTLNAAGAVDAGRRNEHTSIHPVDKELYAAAFSDAAKTCVEENSAPNGMGMCDDEDDLIPKEYLLPPNKSDLSQSVNTEPIAYEETKNELQLSGDCSQVLDHFWEQEYGDGFDPMLFIEECCRHNRGAEIPTNVLPVDRKYTSRLLQRCWERAVHAVSSTVTVHVTDKQPNVATDHGQRTVGGSNGEVQSKEECRNQVNSSIQTKTVTALLHVEAMNIVDSVMDLLLSENSGFIKNMFASEEARSSSQQPVQWKDVLKLLQATVETSKANSQLKQNRSPLPLNKTTLKAITMRVLERYGDVPHKLAC